MIKLVEVAILNQIYASHLCIRYHRINAVLNHCMHKLPPGKIIYHHVSAETLYALNIVDREVPAADKNLMEFL